MNNIALSETVRVDDWTAERAIIVSRALHTIQFYRNRNIWLVWDSM